MIPSRGTIRDALSASTVAYIALAVAAVVSNTPHSPEWLTESAVLLVTVWVWAGGKIAAIDSGGLADHAFRWAFVMWILHHAHKAFAPGWFPVNVPFESVVLGAVIGLAVGVDERGDE